MKTCTKCGETMPLEEFSPRSASRDGHVSRCKACNRETSRAYGLRRQAAKRAALGPRECAGCGAALGLDTHASRRFCSGACRGRADRAANPEKYRRYRQNRPGVQLIREAKRVSCLDCGGFWPDNPEVMDFDHRPGTVKVGNPGEMKGNYAALVAEIAKCDVVCANCHRMRTARRAGWLDDNEKETP